MDEKSIIMVSDMNQAPEKVLLDFLSDNKVAGRENSSLHSPSIQQSKIKFAIFVAINSGKVMVGHPFIRENVRSFSVCGSSYLTFLKRKVVCHTFVPAQRGYSCGGCRMVPNHTVKSML